MWTFESDRRGDNQIIHYGRAHKRENKNNSLFNHGMPGVTKHKQKEIAHEDRIARNKERRKARKERQKKGEKGVTHTIESKRIPDVTVEGTQTEEWEREVKQDELETIYSGERIPKILITLSQDASLDSLGFCKELACTIPNAFFLPRRKLTLKEDILPTAIQQGYSAVMVFNEDQKKLNKLLVCHLPNGPTAEFKVFSAKRRCDLRPRGGDRKAPSTCSIDTPIERVIPGLWMSRFQTAIGQRLSRILEALFPVPQCDAVTASLHNRFVTFYNMRDYIFFRSHRYELKERITLMSKSDESKSKKRKVQKKLAMRELGPRFTLKPLSVRKGGFGQTTEQYEWLRKKRTQETSRLQFAV